MSVALPVMRVLEQGGKFVQSVKYGCELAGRRAGSPRLPLQSLTSEGMSELEKVIRNLETQISKIILDG
jgi:4-hydroxy-tetrahydrodipicolinate synthase